MTWEPSEVDVLSEVAGACVYIAECRACHIRRMVDLEALVNRVGPSFPVRNILPRLKCRCGSKDVVAQVIPRWHAKRILKDWDQLCREFERG